MTVMRIKGVKRYRAKGLWYAYHRKTGTRLQAEFGTGEFFTELAAIERRLRTAEPLPGTPASFSRRTADLRHTSISHRRRGKATAA